MPLRRQVKTLKQLCIPVIIDNLTDYSTAELQCIPPNLSEKLVQHFDDVEKYRPDVDHHDRNRLINANMNRFTVSLPRSKWYSLPDWNTVLHGLTSLTCIFFGQRDYTPEHQDFFHLIRLIPNVVILELQNGYSINDDIMEAIGDNCTKLEILKLSCKVDVTDDGIRRLCQSKSPGIKYLELNSYKITTEGCLLALNNLKELQVYKCSILIDAFVRLFARFIGLEPSMPTFQLRDLPMIEMDKVEGGFLECVTKCCPKVSTLKLHFTRNFPDFITELKNCNENVSFEIRFSECQILASNLNDIGARITCLHLCQMNVNLEAIGFGCPNLKKLILYRATFDLSKHTDRRNCQLPFLKLQYLDVVDLIPDSQLKLLLQNCFDLETLNLSFNNELTDDVMISLLSRANSLKQLTRFSIVRCDKVSKLTIFELLLVENQLGELVICGCNGIEVSHLLEIQSYIKRNNYRVSTHFFG